MTSPIGAVGGFTPIALPRVTGAVEAPGATGAAGASGAASASGANFASQLSRGLESLEQGQQKADDLAVQASTGKLTDVHDYMIASSEASLALQLTTAVRNKALDAFNEIMRMQA